MEFSFSTYTTFLILPADIVVPTICTDELNIVVTRNLTDSVIMTYSTTGFIFKFLVLLSSSCYDVCERIIIICLPAVCVLNRAEYSCWVESIFNT